MASERRFAVYLRATTATIVIGALLGAAFVGAVDPYRLYGVVDVAGLNRRKPRPIRFQDEIKLANATFVAPDAIILGNSRAESGLDPDAAPWRERGLRAYNLAIAGTGIATANGQLDYLIARGRTPKVVVLGVEFLDFLGNPVNADGEPALASPHQVYGWRWRIEALLSLTSIRDALETLIMQRNPDAETLTAHGFNPLAQYGSMARREGYYPLFRQRAQENAKVYIQKPTSLPARSSDFETLRALLDTAARHRIELAVVIYPYHAQFLAMLQHGGFSSTFAEWKSRLVAAIDAARASNPAFRVTLWDFSGYGGPRCEAIPRAGDRTTETQWYWEAGHFKPALGDRMLARILLSASKGEVEDGFGIGLTRDTLRFDPARLAAERAACEARDPALFAEAAELIDAARSASR